MSQNFDIPNQRFDIVNLPSEGKFYSNGASQVKMLYLTGADEGILTAPNLLQDGTMIDVLLRRKVLPIENKPFVSPDEMLIGDRLALLIFLRATMDPIYNMEITSDSGKKFTHELNLLEDLKLKEIEVEPDENGLFTYYLPTSKVDVKFRLMTASDEKFIRDQLKKGNNLNNIFRQKKLEHLIIQVGSETDEMKISQFVRNMPLKDFRLLDRYMEDVTPTFNLRLNVLSPWGETIETFLRFGLEFWYPSI